MSVVSHGGLPLVLIGWALCRCVAGLEVGIEGNAAEEAAEVSESTPKNPNAVRRERLKSGIMYCAMSRRWPQLLKKEA